jgi:hypothetical protein
VLSFEIKKVFKRMPIKSLFSIILLIFAALVFNDWRQQQNQTTFIQEQLALYHETFQRWLQQKPAADRPIYQRNLTRVEQLQKSTNTQQPTAFMNAYYNYFIDPTKLQAFWVPFLGESSDNGEFYTLLKANELNDTYSEISWLKKKHVTPIFPQTVLTNPETLANFNGSQATMQTFKKANQRHYLSGWAFIWQFFKGNYFLLLLLLISLVCGNILVSELNRRNPTIDFLLLRQSPRRIFWTKYWTANLLGCGLIASILLISFVALSLIFGAG